MSKEQSNVQNLGNFTVNDAASGSSLTTNFGTRLSDTDNSLKAGNRGPIIMDDFHFREKVMHFDHERIPERAVHARGAGAHGIFICEENLEDLTVAEFLRPKKETPVFIRFSTVAGSRGSSDTVRDVRGFAIKFYTNEGNFDLVGNNIPVFFIQDAIKFPDLIHAAKPEPHNEIPQAQTGHTNFWDFISLSTESAHMVMWAMSDRAIPRSLRMMQGFGIHTFVFYNKEGVRRFIKFHLTPINIGVHSLVWDEAVKINGADPDFHRRDLWDAIESGQYPEWEVSIQVVKEADEDSFDFDILDATKLIPENLVPRKRIGRIILNRNPDNFFAEVEQVAFDTGHLVPGIAPSNDPLLQGRLFSYFDTQLTRLGGPNFQEIPINRPHCPVINNQRDGFHRMTINKAKVNYFPNRFGCPAITSMDKGGYVHPPSTTDGSKLRARGPKFAEHFNQARKFYISMTDWEQDHIASALIFEITHVEDLGVRERMVDFLNHIDHDLAIRVAKNIGVDPPTNVKHNKDVTPSPNLSQTDFPSKSIESRRIAFLIGPGFNGAQATQLSKYFTAQGAKPVLIGPHLGKFADDTGAMFSAQATWFNSKSVTFDAVVLVGGEKSIAQLQECGDIIAFVNEAYKHGKPIIALGEGVKFVRDQEWKGISLVKEGQSVESSQGVVTANHYSSEFDNAVFKAVVEHRFPKRDTKRVPA